MKRLHTYSQHFLRDPRLVAELIGHTNLRKNDTVIDIGAGSGVISSVLARRCKAVIAIEPEPQTYRKLESNTRRYQNVTTIQTSFDDYVLPSVPYKVFANIPFSISSDVVRRLCVSECGPRAIYLIIQKQFARKLLAQGGESYTSQLGMTLYPWWTVRIRRPLKKTDFWPHPAVDTVLIEIKPRTDVAIDVRIRDVYEEFVNRCYTNPRYFASLSVNTVAASRCSGEELMMLFLRLDESLR